MSRKYGYESIDEILARLSAQSRQEEALRYAALRLATLRQPIRAAVAASLRSLADRFEPAARERTELVRQ
jgi:hypothetical protein